MRRRTRRPRRASKKGASRAPEGGSRGPSRQARRTLVSGRGPRRQQGAGLPSLVAPGRARQGTQADRLPMGLYLYRRASGERRRLHSRAPRRQCRSHEPVPRPLRRHPARGRPRRDRPRRRRLARPQGTRHPGEPHSGLPAALLSELNPVERLWLYLRDRFLSIRVLDDTNAIIDACCAAWNKLLDEEDRIQSLCAYPWIMEISS